MAWIFDETDFEYLIRALAEKKDEKSISRRSRVYLKIQRTRRETIRVELRGKLDGNEVSLYLDMDKWRIEKRNPPCVTFFYNNVIYHPILIYLPEDDPNTSNLSLLFIDDILHLDNACLRCLVLVFNQFFRLIDEYMDTHPTE